MSFISSDVGSGNAKPQRPVREGAEQTKELPFRDRKNSKTQNFPAESVDIISIENRDRRDGRGGETKVGFRGGEPRFIQMRIEAEIAAVLEITEPRNDIVQIGFSTEQSLFVVGIVAAEPAGKAVHLVPFGGRFD